MLPEGVAVRQMQESDLEAVLELIEEIDEDDAEEAEYSYQHYGLDNQFVLTENEQVIGVTGYREASGTDNTCWLSWTYLAADRQGKGYGTRILDSLLEHLASNGVRKVFVSTSDYRDDEDGDIYAAARKMYESVGFRQEVRHPDYYDEGETQFIYGLRLNKERNDEVVEEDTSIVSLEGIDEIDETDDAYFVDWKPKRMALFGGKRQFGREEVEEVVAHARECGARVLFVSFPSNMKSVVQPLTMAGFFEEGRLRDYYRDGVDEVHYRINF